MQFAGQRTDENFKPIGEPHNWLIALTDEVLPDPDAILITGITPQKSREEGYTEAEFLQMFSKEVLQPDTVITGFNNVRFDDEFMRQTLWRNFYDPYEWQWQNDRSRWDLLDAIRMIRALRPEGINWPFEERPKEYGEHGRVLGNEEETIKVPSNRLELLTKANNLEHDNAHDALSDVRATIAVAKMLKKEQPKIFDYLLSVRGKQAISKLIDINNPQPIVYTSGRYSNNWQKTTVVLPIAPAANGAVLVFDLRVNPAELAKLSDEELSEKAFIRDPGSEFLPVKNLKPNACPAVAPLGVFNKDCQDILGLSMATIERHYKSLVQNRGLIDRLVNLFEKNTEAKKAGYEVINDPDFQLYDGFLNDKDRVACRVVRSADKDSIADITPSFTDERLDQLLLRYKARNFPRILSANDKKAWQEYVGERITNGLYGQLSLEQFAVRLSELSQVVTDENKQFLLQELQLYAENLADQ